MAHLSLHGCGREKADYRRYGPSDYSRFRLRGRLRYADQDGTEQNRSDGKRRRRLWSGSYRACRLCKKCGRDQNPCEDKITFDTGYGWNNLQTAIDEAVSDYLLTLRKSWAASPCLIVRISQIETRILDIPGIIDIQDTSVNGKEDNLILGT